VKVTPVVTTTPNVSGLGSQNPSPGTRHPEPTILKRFRPTKKGPYRIHADGSVYRDEGKGARYLGKLKPDDPNKAVLDLAMGRKG